MGRSPDEIRDELRVLRSQGGDAEAFEELVARWQPRLWRHALSLTGEREAARDALQEAWMAIVRGLPRLDDPARFPGWAHRIVRNKSADLVRRRGRRRRLAEAVGSAPAPQAPGPDRLAGVREAWRRLPPERRALLALRYADGLGPAEIGELLAIPEGTAKSRLHHAREALRRALEGGDADE